MRNRGAFIVISIFLVTLLFAVIVGKYWLSGQKKRFLTKRAQIMDQLQGNPELSAELKKSIEEFNELVTQHIYLRYLDIPTISSN